MQRTCDICSRSINGRGYGIHRKACIKKQQQQQEALQHDEAMDRGSRMSSNDLSNVPLIQNY